MLNCVRGSEVCTVAQKSHSKKMHGLGVSSVKNVLLYDDKISLEDLCLLRQNAVLPGKQLLLFEGASCSKMSITV